MASEPMAERDPICCGCGYATACDCICHYEPKNREAYRLFPIPDSVVTVKDGVEIEVPLGVVDPFIVRDLVNIWRRETLKSVGVDPRKANPTPEAPDGE